MAKHIGAKQSTESVSKVKRRCLTSDDSNGEPDEAEQYEARD